MNNKQQNMDKIQCGTYEFKWNDTIKEMDDSTNLLNTQNLSALQRKLANDGYILLRNQIPTNLIDDALEIVVNNLNSTWNCIQDINTLNIKPGSKGILLTGYKPITHNKKVLSLLHCKELQNIMYKIFNCSEPITYDTKWCRVKGKNEFTEQHSDFYRFSDNFTKMVTVWMPLIDITINRGPLAVCPRSHLLRYPTDKISMEEKVDVELPEEFEQFNKTSIWRTTNFNKGDILIFDIRTIHASLINKTDKFRISIDTRWQPKNVIKFWNDSYIRFPQFIQINNDQNKDKNNEREDQKDKDQEIDLNEIMMDCTFTDSDNDIINSLDFDSISKRLCEKTKIQNDNKTDFRSTFV